MPIIVGDDFKFSPDPYSSSTTGNRFGIDDKDWNDVVDTVISEAVGGGPEGMSAVANVINNRARESGKGLGDVVRQPNQFAGYSSPGPDTLKARQDPKIRAEASDIVAKVLSGDGPGTLDGVTHFAAKGANPSWASGMEKVADVGGNTFYRARKPDNAAVKAIDANVDHGEKDETPKLATLAYTNQDAKRNLPVVPELETELRQSVTDVYGPGYKVEVMSGGQGEHSHGITGSRRHTTKTAGDVWVVGPDGKRLSGDQLMPLAQHWLKSDIGSVGFPVNGKNSLHLDLLGGSTAASEPLQGREGRFWFYGNPTGTERQDLQAALDGRKPAKPAPGRKAHTVVVPDNFFNGGADQADVPPGWQNENGLWTDQNALVPPGADIPADALRPFQPGEQRKNPDGSVSTEISTTWQLPDGKWVNVPSLWMGPNGPVQFGTGDEDHILGAMKAYEAQNGDSFKRYDSEKDAATAAEARSAAGGAGAGPQITANDRLDTLVTQLNDKEPGRYTTVNADEFDAWHKDWEKHQPNSLMKGLLGSLRNQNPDMLGKAMDALGVLTGNETLTTMGDAVSHWGQTGSYKNLPKVDSIASIRHDSLGHFMTDVADYAGYSLGQGLGSMAPGLVTGGAAAAVSANPIVGLMAGAAGPSYVLNLGDIYGSTRDDKAIAARVDGGKLTKQDVAKWSALGAVAMTALDVASLENITNIGKKAFKDTVVKRILKGLAEGSLVEGSTEGLQEVISQSVQAALGDDKSMADRVTSVIDNAVAGMLTGGVVSGSTAAVHRGHSAENSTDEPLPTAADETLPPPSGPLSKARDHGEKSVLTPGRTVVINDAVPGRPDLGVGEMHGKRATISEDQSGLKPNTVRVVLPDGRTYVMGQGSAWTPERFTQTWGQPDASGPAGAPAEGGGGSSSDTATTAPDTSVPKGAPAVGSAVTVKADGIDPFQATIDDYADGEAVVHDASGEVFQVPLSSVSGTSPASSPAGTETSRPGSETATKPPVESPERAAAGDQVVPPDVPAQEPKAADTKSTLPPKSETSKITDKIQTPPKAGQRVIVEGADGKRFAAALEGWTQTDDGADEALVKTDTGASMQVPLDRLYTTHVTNAQVEAEAQRNSEAATRVKPGEFTRTVKNTAGDERTLQFPDATHAALFDLGRERQISKKLSGASQLDRDKAFPAEQQRLATELGMSADKVGQLADDYRFRTLRSANRARSSLPVQVRPVNDTLMTRFQKESQRQQKKAAPQGEMDLGTPKPAETSAPQTENPTPATRAADNPNATWWNGLSAADRKNFLDSAGVKRSPNFEWSSLGAPIRDKLLKARHQIESAIDGAAHDAATSPANELPEPSQAQKEAGNYKVGHVRLGGMDISVENPEGSQRKGRDRNGKDWSITMKSHYGYFRGTVGPDKDHVDTFIKPGTESLGDDAPVFVIDQRDPQTGKFDEPKVMLGFDSEKAARAAYMANYEKGWKGLGDISETTIGGLKRWFAHGDTTKPFAPKWFKSRARAEDFVKRKKLGTTHEIIENGPRHEVRIRTRETEAEAAAARKAVQDAVMADAEAQAATDRKRSAQEGMAEGSKYPDAVPAHELDAINNPAPRPTQSAKPGNGTAEDVMRKASSIWGRALEDQALLQRIAAGEGKPPKGMTRKSWAADVGKRLRTARMAIGDLTREATAAYGADQAGKLLDEAKNNASSEISIPAADTQAENPRNIAWRSQERTNYFENLMSAYHNSGANGDKLPLTPPIDRGSLVTRAEAWILNTQRPFMISLDEQGRWPLVEVHSNPDDTVTRDQKDWLKQNWGDGARAWANRDAPPTEADYQAILNQTRAEYDAQQEKERQLMASEPPLRYPDEVATEKPATPEIDKQRKAVEKAAAPFTDPIDVAMRAAEDPNPVLDQLEQLRQDSWQVDKALMKKYGVTRVDQLDDAPLTDAERHYVFYSDAPTDRERIDALRNMLEPVFNLGEATSELRLAAHTLPTNTDVESMSSLDKQAVGRLLFLGAQIEKLGGDGPAVVRHAVEAEAGRYADPQDAEFMARDMLKRLAPFVHIDGGAAAPEAVAAPAPALTDQSGDSSPGPIEDFGEEIGGARKHLAQQYAESLAEAVDVEAEPLSKSFPAPNYERLANDGVPQQTLALVGLMRSMIPNKPRRGYKVKRWAEDVTRLRGFSERLLSGTQSADNLMAELETSSASELRAVAYTARAMESVKPADIPKVAKWRIRDGMFSMLGGEHFNPAKRQFFVENGKGRMMMGPDGRHLFGGTLEDVLPGAREAISAELATKQDAAPEERSKYTKVNLFRDRATGGVYIGFRVRSSVIRLKGGFDTVSEARDYVAENRDELQAKIDEMRAGPNLRRSENAPRAGQARREGDISPEDFDQAFGFRGVQFGNYVEGPRRQEDLNRAYDALMDLADVLGLPPRAISLEGKLGLAFGARGRGGKRSAAAHYEPGQVVINLTKNAGPGSLAHEWLHGLDNYFARQDEAGGYMSERSGADGPVRDVVRDAWEAVNAAINSGGFLKRAAEFDRARSKPYFSTTRELAARAFERYIIDRLGEGGVVNDYLANIDDESGAYPTAQEMQDGIREAYDRLFDTIEHEKTDAGDVRLFSPARQQTDPRLPPARNLLTGDDMEALRRIVEKVGGLKNVAIRASITFENGDKGWGIEGPMKAAGYYNPVNDMIALAADVADDRTAYHEAFHRLQQLYLTPEERALLRDEAPRLRRIVRSDPDMRPYADAMDQTELEAEAFSIYAQGKSRVKPYRSIRAAWDHMVDLVQRVRNFAKGRGFDSASAIFRDAATGEFAKRGAVRSTRRDNLSPASPWRGTPAFKRWFGDSKVVADNGDPLVVYHGSTSPELERFDPDKLGSNTKAGSSRLGFFFASNPAVASSYAHVFDGYADTRVGRVLQKLTGGLYARFNEALARPLGLSARAEGSPNVTPVHLSIQNPYVVDFEGSDSRERTYHDIIKTAKASGHDGVLLRNTFDPGTGIDGEGRTDVWVAFKPNQIKSAFNSGAFDPENANIMAQKARDAERRRFGIPPDARDVSVFRNINPLNRHPDYAAAKGGDAAAAVRLVADLVKPAVRNQLKSFGPDVTFVAVGAEEAAGRNAIPRTLAEYAALAAGADTDRTIVQANRVFHTGAGAMERLANRPRFDGAVTPGRKYVLVDDVSVMGSTLAGLADHIRSGGGEVAGVVTLVNASRNGHIAADSAQVRDVRRRFGDAIESEFGLAPESLTASEAHYLRNFRDADALRTRNAAAAAERDRRLRAQGLREPGGEGPGEGELGPDGAKPSLARGPGVVSEPVTKAKIGEELRGKLTDLEPTTLALVPLNYFSELKQPNMSAIDEYMRLKRQMDAYRGDKHAAMDDVAQTWRKYVSTGPKRAEALADLMHSATLAGIDPTRTDEEETGKSGYAALRRQYDALPAKGRQLFTQVRNAYAAQAKELDKILLRNIERSQEIARQRSDEEYEQELRRIEASRSMTPEMKKQAAADAQKAHAERKLRGNWSMKARMTKLRALFERTKAEGPYFPLARFGDYFVSVRDVDGTVLSFSRREKAADMNRLARDMKAAYAGATVETGRMSNASQGKSAMDPRMVAEIETILNGAGVDSDVMDEIWQRYLQTMPDLSTRKRFIHRKGTAGFDRDALRAFGNHMFHASHQMARLKYGLDLGEMVHQTREQARKAKDPAKGMALANELQRRHEWLLNPTGSSAVQNVTSAMFVWYLGATPAAAMVNLTQTVMMGVPILGSRLGGMTRATAQIARASADFTRGRGGVQNVNLSADEHRAMNEFYDAGLIDRTQSHDLAGVGETGARYSPYRQKLMNAVSWMFHKAEVANREVTALAAYRMARDRGQSHAQAVDTAMDLTWKTHFDYSNSSRPRVMQGDTAKLLLVFQNYQLNMWYRLARDLHQSFKGATPEARREARYQLAGIAGMMTLLAGVHGFFGYNLIMALLGMFFDDKNDPMSFKAEMDKHVLDLFGPTLGGMVLNGAPGHLAGIDLTSRIGMPDFFVRGPDHGEEGKDWFQQLIIGAMGVVPSTAINMFDGFQLMKEGKVARGVEAIAPKPVRDAMKAWRYANEGILNKNGDVTMDLDQVAPWDVISQLMGFTSAKVSEMYDRNGDLMDAERTVQNERHELMNRFALAWRMDDEEGKQRTLEAIREWNKRPYARAMPITSDSLKQSLRARERNRRKRQGGVLIQNEKLGSYLRSVEPQQIYK